MATGMTKKRGAQAKTKLRPILQAFADAMEATLKANDHKSGWESLSYEDLIERMRKEVDELEDCTVYRRMRVEKVTREATDVANYAMFIAAKKALEKTSKPQFDEEE